MESDGYWSISSEAIPEALFAHTVMDPLFSSLYEPFVLRSGRAFPPSFDDLPEKAERSRERRRACWQEVDSFFTALDLGVGPELLAVRPGGGWSRLRSAEQLSAKVALAEVIRRRAEGAGPSSVGARYRALRLLPLLKRYYAKAKKDGRVLLASPRPHPRARGDAFGLLRRRLAGTPQLRGRGAAPGRARRDRPT